jgi:predicted restriction endonuclease
MSLTDVDREAVLAAMAEYDKLGRDRFLEIYGFGRARRYVVLHDGREYESKALMGAAHRHATGQALRASEFSGGVQTVVPKLGELGFDFRDLGVAPKKSDEIVIGEIPGVPVGTTFVNRAEAAELRVHRALIAGIVGNGREGAESVVSSGGYEDDQDSGSLIIYTGHGGQDAGRQVEDQSFESSGNAALRTSMINGTPVRVVRGPDRESPYSPDAGYRYDGLFRVDDASRERGQSGFYVCRFRLVEIFDDEVAKPGVVAVTERVEREEPVGNDAPVRRDQTVQRIVRSTAVADYVKRLYDHTCQVCGIRLSVGARGYSEGAHIQALGRPHLGPDIAPNVLCLCANCHVLFDYGALVVEDDHSLVVNGEKTGEELKIHPKHGVGPQYLAHHREAHDSRRRLA